MYDRGTGNGNFLSLRLSICESIESIKTSLRLTKVIEFECFMWDEFDYDLDCLLEKETEIP